TEPLGRAINAYVMQDEARHVAFGRLALRDYYPHLGEQERDEREQFVVEACVDYVLHSPFMKQFQNMLFTRIVPTLKDIGLWGPRIQQAFTEMGVMDFAKTNLDELAKHDEDVAAEFDRLRAAREASINQVIAEA